MEAASYRHTAHVHRDSWFMRFYCWLWAAEAEEADFCKLFWGYVLAPVGLLVRVIFLPVVLVVRGVRALADKLSSTPPAGTPEWETYVLRQELREQRKAELSERWGRRAQVLFGFVSRVADRVVAVAKRTWRIVRYPAYAIAAALTLAVAVGVGWLLYLFGLVLADNLNVVLIILVIVAALVGAVGGAYVAYRLSQTRVGSGVKNGALTFSGAIRTGALGVKARTCPRIVLVVDDRRD